jgi:hypothetical protein
MPRLPALPRDIAQLTAGRRFTAYPEPCFMKMRLKRGGPWVPALIWLPCPFVVPLPAEETPAPEEWCRPHDRSRVLRGRIGERDANPAEVWERGYLISAKEYHWRLGLLQWAARHAPEQPEANPRQRAALERLPSLL